MDPVVHGALRAGLTLLLLASAAHKLRDWSAFRAALAGYRIVPERLTGAAAGAVAGLEIAAGSGLALGLWRPVPALTAAVLLAVYAAAIAINLARGRRDIDCGCGGPAGRVSLSEALLARNAALIAAALAVALPATRRPLVWLDGVTLLAALGTTTLLYAALETLLATPATARTRRRDRQGALGLALAPSQPLPDGRGSELALDAPGRGAEGRA